MSELFTNYEFTNIFSKLAQKRPIFCSEDDFKFELSNIIKEELKNKNNQIFLEYNYQIEDSNKKKIIHIDILVIIEGKWYPIELKYKTKGNSNRNNILKYVDKNQNTFMIVNHSAHNENIIRYENDIQRIENIKKEQKAKFGCGYAIMLTNDEYYFKNITKSTWQNYGKRIEKESLVNCKLNKIDAIINFKYTITKI